MKLSFNHIQVTVPTPQDAEGMQMVYFETWLDTYPNGETGITREDIVYMFRDALTEETLRKKRAELAAPRTETSLSLVAKDGDKVVGLCGLAEFEKFNKLGFIYVLPDYQKKGVGKKLWEVVAQFLNKEKETIVHVADYNVKAIEFYKKIGFSDTGRRFSDEKWRMKSGAIITEMEMVLTTYQI